MKVRIQLRQHNIENGNLATYRLGLSLEPFPDPKDVGGDIYRFTDFMRFLAPPPRGRITDAVKQGERMFAAIGCAICHVPSMMTGASRYPALAHQEVHCYSDLLLHDIATGNSVAQAGAGPFEVKTPPLWGLRVRSGFLHDRRAKTMLQAIEAHGGEASQVTDRYNDLDADDQQQILEFLRSL